MKSATSNGKLAKFYLTLLDLQEEITSHQWPKVSNLSEEKWLDGEPVLSLQALTVPVELARQVVDSVVAATLKSQPSPDILTPSTAAALNNLEPLELEEFVQAALTNAPQLKTKWAAKLNISEPMLDFITSHIARIILTSYSKHACESLDLEKWHYGHCPVCGESPIMAKLTGKYGVRVLHCGQCETEWRFDRLGCPYCNNKDSGKLSFITPQTQKQYRLYLCDQCKSYLKTVDERQCGKVDLFCEDLATVDFDQLAATEGYQRGNKRYRV